MAEQSDKSDSDSRDTKGSYLDKLKNPEHTDPEKIAANKLLLNDVRQFPELWDDTHKAYGMLQSIHLVRMLEVRHNLQRIFDIPAGDLQKKWKKISKFYEESVRMGNLPLSNGEFLYNRNDIVEYPYTNEMQFYNPIVERLLQAAKSEKRKRSDDEPTHSKREVHSEPSFDHFGEESSSQSLSLETEPSSHLDTDSQDSSKLLPQHDTHRMKFSRLKSLLVNRDKGTQTSPSYLISEDSDSSILESLISLHNQLDQPKRKQFDKKLAKLVKEYEPSPSSSEDSSAAQ